MRPSLPQRTSRASASQDRSDQQQQADSNTDLGRTSHHYPASDPEGNGPGVAGRRDAAAAAAAAATTPRPLPTMEHGSEDEAEDDDSGGGGDEDERGDLPMSMTASVILTNLPKDASAALKDVEELDNRKANIVSFVVVSLRLNSINSLPTTRVSADSEATGVQDQRVVKVQYRLELFEEKGRCEAWRWTVFVRQQRLRTWLG
ncbi:ubiquitin-like protein ATG12 [Exophiala spinifera]|uniref:Ubiquitin-like protein ATG12 n=1 Tax=Exophiala spinifera TaxID=91928 RepID=A0A0D1ZTV1_9EURO|nr:ubiquitin-like protein ATG12 [Exophiala spinifera]KIW16222.1 ubiquitin-like protein ATG12 [Exophiala spinifera]